MFPNYVATVFRIVFKHAFKIAASRQVLTRTKSEIVQHLIHSFSFNSLTRITPQRKSLLRQQILEYCQQYSGCLYFIFIQIHIFLIHYNITTMFIDRKKHLQDCNRMFKWVKYERQMNYKNPKIMLLCNGYKKLHNGLVLKAIIFQKQ